MKGKIMIGIAEDHPLMLSTLRDVLLTNGDYEVIIEAVNGHDLITKIEKASIKPEVCFVNGKMPVLDGCETVSKLKKNNPWIKVIAYTNDSIIGDKMLKRGGDVYLPKNSCVSTIFKCISTLVEFSQLEKGHN